MTYRVRLPYLTNTVQIKAGDKLIAKHIVQEKTKPVKKTKTWQDDLVGAEKRRRKGEEKGTD